jgi:SHS2 domain-containing protein
MIGIGEKMGGQRQEKRYEYLEHTADAYIAAYGETIEEAFENAALATFNVMTEVEKVEPSVEENVEVKANDEYALLYNWLENLLIRFETTGKVYSRFKVYGIEKTPLGLRLKARIWGEPLKLEKHLSKVGVKAVTYHQMEIIKDAKGYVTVRFILDI